MSEVKYKEFTKEEEEIYDKAIAEIKDNIEKGVKFEEACNMVEVKDEELKHLILEDFLKITVAELHFTQRKTMEEIAKELDIPVQSVVLTYKRMLNDIMNTHKGNLGLGTPDGPDLTGPAGNA
ncbi:MAG: hypothetical protein JSV21_09755 [Nitrospirota bacterium]|nr:MAG: hypothetical protein JSV21_09755 [Nitrospirota bacterium]